MRTWTAGLASAAVLAAMAAAGCGGSKGAVRIDPQEQVVGARWNATLATPAALVGATQVRGSGWMAADAPDSAETRAHVTITNAVPGGEHPWHVHLGRCGSDQGILGPPNAYRPLQVGSGGEAEATALLPTAMPRSGEYFINVHASAANMGTIVACGNLAPPVR